MLTLKWTWVETPTPQDVQIGPSYGSSGAIGLDLRAWLPAAPWVMLPNHQIHIIRTNLSVEIPEGFYGRIAPRSGLAAKFGLDVLAGVVDPDYRGEIKVILTLHGENSVRIEHGDRIAQLILERADRLDLRYVGALGETERGSAGLGSTGV